VKEGVAAPDISSVDAFKAFLVSAPSLALPDPKAGGTSAIYIDGLIRRLGLAEVVAPKAKLKAGGYAADLVASGDALYVIHQISEIRPVKGVTVVGPLPADIQLVTTYSAALAAGAAESEPARAFLAALAGPLALEAVQRLGMDPIR
jgi:molybdate transport system substrate-binding protein